MNEEAVPANGGAAPETSQPQESQGSKE